MWTPPHSRRCVAALVSALVVAAGFVVVTAPSAADVNDGWSVIDVGFDHTCGVTTVGEAYCWGSTAEGALGNGASGGPGREHIPVQVPTPVGVTWATIDTGEYHTCALTTDGDLYCWGSDNLDAGTLGNGPVVAGQYLYPDPTPVVTPPGVTWASISAGRHSCALTTDGDAYCWGYNDQGQIGDGTTTNRDVPTLVTAPAGVTWAEVRAGSSATNNLGSRMTCGLSTDGAGYCWGADTHGQLGDGATLEDTSLPSPVVTRSGRPGPRCVRA